LRLLIFLARARAKSAPTDAAIHKAGHAATVAAAIRYMEDGFAGPLRIEQVASAVFLSPDRFTEVFSAEVGMTPRAYVRRLRVERAVSLLQTTELTLATVAEQSGFADAAHLSRVVREVTGDTPRTVRLRAQQSAGRGRLVLESRNGDTTPVA
jgi:transcriptional regulator GlxA family with amidase domain